MSWIVDLIVAKAQEVQDGYNVASTGEMLAVAFVLNRPDIIEEMGYTLVDAIQRIGPEWMEALPCAVERLNRLR